MAAQRTCDWKGCGKSPAHPVMASVALWSVVVEGQPTGHSEALDACEEHQRDVALALHEHCVEQLGEQVGFHRELHRLDEEIMEASTLISGTASELRGFESVEGAPKKLRQTHEGALARVADAEEQRAELLVEAKAKSDAAKERLLKAVKK